MRDDHIVNIITKQINNFENLIKQEDNDRIKLYYYYMLLSLLKIRYDYTGQVYDAIHLGSNVRRMMQEFILKKEITMVETIENSRELLRVLTENILDYVNQTDFCYEENNAILIDNRNFLDIIREMLREEKIDEIYTENVKKGILDFNKHSNIGGSSFAAMYNLLSLDGNYLIVIKNSLKDINSLLNYSHEYGHFLVDYLLDFNLQKTTCKNHSYNEIVSEILHMKSRRILLDNNYMSLEREVKEEYSFISKIFILYIYSHYDFVGNKKIDKIIKQAINDTKQKYPNIKINIKDLSLDSIISAYNYGIARYIGSLYEIRNINVLRAKNISSYDGNDPLKSFFDIGLEAKDFTDSSTIKNNLSKILIRK